MSMSVVVCVCGCVGVCVCLFVCLRPYPRTRRTIFTKFFMHVAYDHSWVLLRWGDTIPRGVGNFEGFLPH